MSRAWSRALRLIVSTALIWVSWSNPPACSMWAQPGDRIQRGSEFVGENRQEFVLQLVGRFRFPARFLRIPEQKHSLLFRSFAIRKVMHDL